MTAGSTLAQQYWALTKPRIVALIVFTAVIGMLLALRPDEAWPWLRLLAGSVGIWLAAASAAAINHLLDQRIDKVMARTSERPLATGALRPRQVLVFALVLGVASMGILLAWVNAISAVLTFGGLIGYAVIYTGFLKRATPQNIVIGGLAGAVPPLLGWATVTGMQREWDWAHALLLVLIIFVWTPPHFWALALYRAEDYARAGLPMLPVTHGNDFTRLQILLYTLVLFAATLLPFIQGMSGWLYLAAAVALGAWFLALAFRLWRAYSEALARRTFRYSIWYLALLFAALLVDHYALG